jgi:hypothetical protein
MGHLERLMSHLSAQTKLKETISSNLHYYVQKTITTESSIDE